MNAGIQDGLIDPKHEENMGTAVFLFMWCVRCQTQKHGGVFVLGGMPLTYAMISERSKFSERKIRRWLDRLREYNYVRVTYLNYKMMKIEVMKAKKWGTRQAGFDYPPPAKKQPPKPAEPLPEKSQSSPETHSPQTVNRDPEPLPVNGQSIIPKTVNRATENGQSKQSCSLRCIESRTKTETEPPSDALLRHGIPLAAWLAYREMRIKIRKPMTDHAVDLAIRKLIELKAAGHDAVAVLDQSILNSWAGLYPIKTENGNGRRTGDSPSDRLKRSFKNLGFANQ